MKFLALALVAFAAFAAQSAYAEELFTSTCDMECIGPYNACSWEAIDGKGTQAECVAKQDKCTKDCVAKNGLKKYVYKPQPHPEAIETPKSTTKAPSYNFRSAKDGKKIN